MALAVRGHTLAPPSSMHAVGWDATGTGLVGGWFYVAQHAVTFRCCCPRPIGSLSRWRSGVFEGQTDAMVYRVFGAIAGLYLLLALVGRLVDGCHSLWLQSDVLVQASCLKPFRVGVPVGPAVSGQLLAAGVCEELAGGSAGCFAGSSCAGQGLTPT